MLAKAEAITVIDLVVELKNLFQSIIHIFLETKQYV